MVGNAVGAAPSRAVPAKKGAPSESEVFPVVLAKMADFLHSGIGDCLNQEYVFCPKLDVDCAEGSSPENRSECGKKCYL